MSSDSSLTDSENEIKVPAKKAKPGIEKKRSEKKQEKAKKRKVESDEESSAGEKPKGKNSDESEDEETVKGEQKSKNYPKDPDGNDLIPIGAKKFASVKRFKGKVLIDVREYYDKDGKSLPGKKGISLSQDEFISLKKVLPELEKMIGKI